MSELQTVELDSLIGEHILDGVDMTTESIKQWDEVFQDANVIRVRLDGKVYTAIEDPSDGYRSSMEKLIVEDCALKNMFPPIKVLAKKKGADEWGGRNDTIELIDVVTGKVVVEFGTDHFDGYYPSFVSAFWPEHMATNSPSA